MLGEDAERDPDPDADAEGVGITGTNSGGMETDEIFLRDSKGVGDGWMMIGGVVHLLITTGFEDSN